MKTPKNLYFNSKVGLPTTHKLVESDVTYVRSDLIGKMLQEQQQTCSDAVSDYLYRTEYDHLRETLENVCLNATE